MAILTYTVLIVDDGSVDRSLYRRYLEGDARCDWRVLEADSVEIGLEWCRTRELDGVLLGDSCAHEHGLTFLESLYGRGRGGQPAVVLVAATGDSRIAVRAMKLGAADYLMQEDLTPESLPLTLQRAIASNPRRRPVEAWDEAFSGGEEQLKVGIQVAGVGLAQVDYAADRVTLSPEAAAIYGFPADTLAISRDRLHATFHPDERAELLRIIEQVLDPAGHGWFAQDHRIVWPTGEVRWLSVRKRVFFERSDAGEYPRLATLAAIDVTDRKRTETALRESENKFSTIFDQASTLLGRVSLDGVLQEINQSALDSIAAQPVDVVGKKLWETPWWMHSQEGQAKLQAAIAQATAGHFVNYEVYFPSGSGETMVTDFSLKPVFDAGGDVVMIIAEGFDITQRKRIEAELLESEARFRTLADNISQLAWMADASGSLFWYNRRWFDYTGTTLADMEGWGWQKVHHPDHLDRVVVQFRRALEVGEVWEDTFPLRKYDGTYRWFLSRARPIKDAAGQILRWFGTNTDVTDLKHTQAELEARNYELDSFAHIVSHDLKAPLRAISNLSEWIEEDLEGLLSDAVQQQMTLLRNRVHRMTGMIDGLLSYARADRSDDPIESVVVADLLQEVIDAVAPPPPFTIAIASHLPRLETRPLLLFQVFANLIGNAVKHHDREDGTVHISSQEQGEFYEFTVADDGLGIEPEYHDRIFMIFQAGNPKNKEDSTGIGLAIVKKIVESEQGSIRLESEVGKGTTFYFTWPKHAQA